MIMTRLKLPLEEIEYLALLKVASDELRSPIDQARFILRQEFERRGLLQADPALVTDMPSKDHKRKQGESHAAY